MISEPWFWREQTLTARAVSTALSPLGALYSAIDAAKRRLTTPAPAPAPVICVGGARLGGVGKTPACMALAEIMRATGRTPAFLTRGYGGGLKGPIRIDLSRHNAEQAGDEPLLLAARAPCWVSANRPAGARAAANDGADVIIMDDGYQNPSLEKTFSLLLVDANDPAGNERIFPAGPLRERLADAAARADAVIAVQSAGTEPVSTPIPDPIMRAAGDKPIFTAHIEVDASGLDGPLLAFCGIARPSRFFDSLKSAGCELVDTVRFADHHPFAPGELGALHRAAKKAGAQLVTTQKDFVRLNAEERNDIAYAPAHMALHNADALRDLIVSACAGFEKGAA